MYSEAFVKEIEYPEYSMPGTVPPPDIAELDARICRCRARMKERLLSHLVIYADREHFASLHYLVNFDPRFEEALLILPADSGQNVFRPFR